MNAKDVISEAWELYASVVDSVAEMNFREVVEPFCERRGLRFLAGNGEWWVSSVNFPRWHPEDFPYDLEWQAVAALLGTEVPGMPANDLGSLMPAYSPEGYVSALIEKEKQGLEKDVRRDDVKRKETCAKKEAYWKMLRGE